MGDNLMEDSHCQTDLDLSPNHRSESSSMVLETSFLGGCNPTLATSTTSTSTSTNDCGHSHHSADMPFRNCQGRIAITSNGDICNGVNQVHLMNGNANGCFSNPTSLSSAHSSSCSLAGHGNNNNNCSPTPLSQPMEASTQTSHSDNMLLSSTSGPVAVVTACGSGPTFDEHCGVSGQRLTILFPCVYNPPAFF